MPTALLILVGFQLAGELAREAFGLPVPGPVIGMFLLAAALLIRARAAGGAAAPVPLRARQGPTTSLRIAAQMLISNMGLLFVPAGVGIVAELGMLQKEWLPIAAGIVGSTLLSIAVTGLVMHWIIRAAHRAKHDAPVEALPGRAS